MNGYWSVVQKEIVHLKRDATTLVIALLLPLIQVMLYGYAIDFDVRHIPAVVVDQDRSRESRDYVTRLRATEYLDPDVMAATEDEAAHMVRTNQAKVAVIIPPNFSREMAAGRAPQVGVLIDGSDSQVASRARLAFAQPPRRGSGQVDARMNVLFNPNMRTATFMIPGLIGLLMQMITVSLTSFSLVREREQGTLEQLMVSPIGRLGLMLGKLTPYAGVAMFEFGLILTFGYFLFDVHVVGSLLGLIVLSTPFILANLALGLLISTAAQNQAQALQFAMLTLMPSVLMSGFIFPRETMPGTIYIISEVLPLTHYLNIVRGVIVRGAAFWDLLPSAGILMLIASALIFVSTRRFRKSLS
ncbi:MAG: hypothetical protein BGO01_05245 [Armatimonadetes bacterium 55-13]|nr:ABC transporter permease [Armatimonadota bacterium]OJU61489.1 MAG: hypothetical protein BGO01_05245 [Armatimonadetes bacterium 55-13]